MRRGVVHSLVRVFITTGRTHQVRIHLAHIGHPLVGDVLYGGAVTPELGRQALHAYRLAFEHPLTHEALSFSSQPPADLLAGMRAWGLDYNRA